MTLTLCRVPSYGMLSMVDSPDPTIVNRGSTNVRRVDG
jgi:hypothetical protein